MGVCLYGHANLAVFKSIHFTGGMFIPPNPGLGYAQYIRQVEHRDVSGYPLIPQPFKEFTIMSGAVLFHAGIV
jgi:hypothetical protein